jgi:AraC-like DNA-binding protein
MLEMAASAIRAEEPPPPPVQIRIVQPAAALAGLVESYYIVETRQTVSDHYLASPGNIRFAPKGEWILTVDGVWVPTPKRSALFGPTDRAAVFGSDGPGIMLGAGLTPLGWAQMFDVPARELSNRVQELADFTGAADADAIATAIETAPDDAGIGRALDRWLIARAESRPAADRRIAAIHRALLAVPAGIAEFAAAAGISERTLHRLCDRAFGFSPKALLRQKRFLRTLERVRGVLDRPLAGLIDDDYFDQAHFNRDFRDFMGMSPTEYFNSPREIMRRAADVRRALNGPGMQGLHPTD